MKYKLIALVVIIYLFFNNRLYCQNKSTPEVGMTKILKIDSLFKCYGVIFDTTYKQPIEIRDIKFRVALEYSDIVLAEKIFVAQYNETNIVTESKKGTAFVNDVKEKFQNYNRQYFGYSDKSGDKNLIIHLFNYQDKRVVRKYIGDKWKNNFLIFLSENPPFEIITYRVNLTQKKLFAEF